MKCRELLKNLEKDMPLELAFDWDNPGLQVGNPEVHVQCAVVALDATDEVVSLAIRENADLILTHHPLLFSPVKNVISDDIVGKRIIRMIEHHICCVAMHTNYDVAPGCMADLAAARLAIAGEPLEVTGEFGGRAIGVGKVGSLQAGMTVDELAAFVKKQFSLPFVGLFGRKNVRGPVSRIAVSPGSGKGMYRFAKEAGAEVLITGDITHHEGLDAAEAGMIVIDAGHYGLEHIFREDMAERLHRMEAGINTVISPLSFPEEVI